MTKSATLTALATDVIDAESEQDALGSMSLTVVRMRLLANATWRIYAGRVGSHCRTHLNAAKAEEAWTCLSLEIIHTLLLDRIV